MRQVFSWPAYTWKIYAKPDDQDLVIVRILGRGVKDGIEREAAVGLLDRYDEVTGFTSMELTTGWHAAIICAAQARGVSPRAWVPVELAVSGPRFAAELLKRGFDLHVNWPKETD